jgi:proline iminopeptidase
VSESGTVDRDGFQLGWCREGRGIPMLVLGAHRFYPQYFPQSLREHFDIVFCDLRQWVPTPEDFDVSAITLDTFSDDIEAVRRAVGFERPIVAGQSQHGSLALLYAERFREDVRGVAAIAPNAPVDDREGLELPADFFQRDADPDRLAAHDRWQARRPASVENAQDFVDNYLANSAKFWFDHTAHTSHLWEGSEINLEVLDRLFQADTLGGFRLGTLDVPVFLALGRYDYALPYYLWDRPQKKLSNLRYRLYERSAHQPPYEQPEEFAADLLDWAEGL